MFKKILAAAMSAMLLLYPLAASAVTWDDVRTTLYPIIEKGEKADNIVIDGGSASFDTKDDTFFIKLKDLSVDDWIRPNVILEDSWYLPFDPDLDLTLENVKSYGIDAISHKADHFKITLDGSTDIGEIYTFAKKGSDVELINNATIGNPYHRPLCLEGNGTYHVTNNGTLIPGGYYFPDGKYEDISSVISLNMTEEEANLENILTTVEAMDLDFGEDPVNLVIEIRDTNNNLLLEPFVVLLVPETVVVDTTPSPEMIRHWKELERQEKAIGGVCGSPYWLKQLYLGYQSLNLRLYLDGKQVNFKQDLGWAGKAPNKELILRINYDDPEKLTMRLDETVLDVLERADFTLITLKEKDGGIVMQYNVADLRAAYETYGLDDDDLLVVGGADDPVMKIGEDGELKPVEE